MSSLAEVRLWGSTIGAVSVDAGRAARFEYDRAFLASGIEVAPLTMPLRSGAFAFPDLNPAGFHGLPGLLADSLPDRYGQALIDAWLAGQGRSARQLRRGRATLLHRASRHGRAGVRARPRAARDTHPHTSRRGAGAARLRGARHRAELVASLAAGHREAGDARDPQRRNLGRRRSRQGGDRLEPASPARSARGSSTRSPASNTGC